MHSKLFLFIYLSLVLLYGVGLSLSADSTGEGRKTITFEEKTDLSIHEGIISQQEDTIWIMKRKKVLGYVSLSKPVLVAQASRDEEWGFFQFPNLSRADDGTLVVTWHMKDDSYESYGKPVERKYTPMESKDNGMSWQPMENNYRLRTEGYDCNFSDGSTLQIVTPANKNINDYKDFPNKIISDGVYSYYYMNEVPEVLQGAYLRYVDKDNKAQSIHASLDDPELLRYAIKDQMPVIWWGSIKQLADRSLIAGVYPGHYFDKKNKSVNSGISFYSSSDQGRSWHIKGRIPYRADGKVVNQGDKSFQEPTYEILADSTFICVMRTGSTSPMYRSFSYSKGKKWTKPKAFTPNGVLPWLKLLNNGVLVLVSGRPGVQIRFSLDGKGKKWTTPIDMLPFMNSDGTFTRDVSCGYTSLLDADDSSFYMVYSDFMAKNIKGEKRKAILFRKIRVESLD